MFLAKSMHQSSVDSMVEKISKAKYLLEATEKTTEEIAKDTMLNVEIVENLRDSMKTNR